MSTWLGDRVPRYLAKHYCIFCEDVFEMGLTFELVDWVKITLPNVGGSHSSVPERLTSPSYRRTPSAWRPLKWVSIQLHSCLQTQNETLALPWSHVRRPLDVCYTIGFPSSQALGHRLELNHYLSWVSSLLTHPVDLTTCQPPSLWELIPYN